MQNAQLVTNAERYYRIMYYGSRASWNLRDSHMFDTLQNLLEFHGPESRAIVWAHNSHIGDSARDGDVDRAASTTSASCAGRSSAMRAYSIGFGTHTGTVAAATELGRADGDQGRSARRWRTATSDSVHDSRRRRNSCCRLRTPAADGAARRPDEAAARTRDRRDLPARDRAAEPLFPGACCREQFDEYIWFDETAAVTPLDTEELEGLPDTYPFGL